MRTSIRFGRFLPAKRYAKKSSEVVVGWTGKTAIMHTYSVQFSNESEYLVHACESRPCAYFADVLVGQLVKGGHAVAVGDDLLVSCLKQAVGHLVPEIFLL